MNIFLIIVADNATVGAQMKERNAVLKGECLRRKEQKLEWWIPATSWQILSPAERESGTCSGHVARHVLASFRAWEMWSKVKMLEGSPWFTDRENESGFHLPRRKALYVKRLAPEAPQA